MRHDRTTSSHLYGGHCRLEVAFLAQAKRNSSVLKTTRVIGKVIRKQTFVSYFTCFVLLVSQYASSSTQSSDEIMINTSCGGSDRTRQADSILSYQISIQIQVDVHLNVAITIFTTRSQYETITDYMAYAISCRPLHVSSYGSHACTLMQEH